MSNLTHPEGASISLDSSPFREFRVLLSTSGGFYGIRSMLLSTSSVVLKSLKSCKALDASDSTPTSFRDFYLFQILP